MTRDHAAWQALCVLPDPHDNNWFRTWNRLTAAICPTVTD